MLRIPLFLSVTILMRILLMVTLLIIKIATFSKTKWLCWYFNDSFTIENKHYFWLDEFLNLFKIANINLIVQPLKLENWTDTSPNAFLLVENKSRTNKKISRETHFINFFRKSTERCEKLTYMNPNFHSMQNCRPHFHVCLQAFL